MNYTCRKIDVNCIFIYSIPTDNGLLPTSHDPKCLIYHQCRHMQVQHAVKVTMLEAHQSASIFTQYHLSLFICSSFKNAYSVTHDYTALNERMIGE
jgi:hypothetical protein